MLASSFDEFLIDLDGVIVVGDRPIDGAVESLKRLQDLGVEITIITNNSQDSRQTIRDTLASFGVDIDESQVVSAGWATARYLAEEGFTSAYVVGTEEFARMLEQEGVTVDPANPEAVVVGFYDEFTYQHVNDAARYARQGVPIIAANADGSYPTENGIEPGTGAFLAAVQSATNSADMTIVGKPNDLLFDLAATDRDASVAVIGDSLSTDIVGANRAGMTAIYVGDEPVEPDGEYEVDYRLSDLTGLFEEIDYPDT
ncbi:HAD-IIA family hydrolase [Halorubrum sp. CBA1125]|uniref:HAD-IIA family hydrolase n=1 Tax=Halorubrum sp. CBA1125 TaxID=2668072 RepID=UPI0012E885D0|nr:HAD-IIA family hydrolase [Halorubrum sp. CBA1125]MUW14550.1 HAD-IIA family hydrolase [Halorubrum sp. CBA1125]